MRTPVYYIVGLLACVRQHIPVVGLLACISQHITVVGVLACVRQHITVIGLLACVSQYITVVGLLLYPEWPHRQCVGLAFRRSHVRCSLSAESIVICSPACIAVCNTWSSGGTAMCRVGGATSQLDLPSLTPLSVAGCG